MMEALACHPLGTTVHVMMRTPSLSEMLIRLDRYHQSSNAVVTESESTRSKFAANAQRTFTPPTAPFSVSFELRPRTCSDITH
jgi:hypothetical protein